MKTTELFSIQNRVAVVTGGSTGIGRHIATGFAAAGAKVYICARTETKVKAAAREISEATGGTCIGIAVDLSTLAGIDVLVAEIAAAESALHILVNNAGTMAEAPIDDYSEAAWDQVIDINLKAPFFILQKFLALLRAGGTAERPASVINIGSVGALKVGPKENYAYQASKGAVHWMAKGLAKRLGRDHITANVIAPGFFESEMSVITSDDMRRMLEGMVPRGRIGTPEDLAGTAIYLASRAGAYVTGSVIPVEGGLSI